MRKKSFTILSIEDNIPDFILLKKALSQIRDIDINVINIEDGEEALLYLYKEKTYKTAIKPDIIILDINLPTISGKEILKKIKADDNLKAIPVIIFSTSDIDKEIEECYLLSANSYITKSFSIENLFKKIASMGTYWLKTAEIPETSGFYIRETNGEQKQ